VTSKSRNVCDGCLRTGVGRWKSRREGGRMGPGRERMVDKSNQTRTWLFVRILVSRGRSLVPGSRFWSPCCSWYRSAIMECLDLTPTTIPSRILISAHTILTQSSRIDLRGTVHTEHPSAPICHHNLCIPANTPSFPSIQVVPLVAVSALLLCKYQSGLHG
jgi:hypothetical protein